MTDTPSGASVDPRVHGTAAALAAVTVTKLPEPRLLSPDDAEALLGPDAPNVVEIEASALKPQLLGLLRWVLTLFAAWLVQRGAVSKGEAAELIPILSGIALAAGTLAWSWAQKRLASRRIRTAAKADPATVVLK